MEAIRKGNISGSTATGRLLTNLFSGRGENHLAMVSETLGNPQILLFPVESERLRSQKPRPLSAGDSQTAGYEPEDREEVQIRRQPAP